MFLRLTQCFGLMRKPSHRDMVNKGQVTLVDGPYGSLSPQNRTRPGYMWIKFNRKTVHKTVSILWVCSNEVFNYLLVVTLMVFSKHS